MKCERCDTDVDKVYPTSYQDEDTGEEKTELICWDCDFDLANGRGELHDDPGKILMDRWEEDYEFDPVNTTIPPWMR